MANHSPVFLSSYPSPLNERDGMMQRVKHIDTLFASCPRTYLDISFRKYWRKQSSIDGPLKVYHLNAFLHYWIISRLIASSSTLYVHSVYNAFHVAFRRYKGNIVLDAHGVVPEELSQERKPVKQLVFKLVEWIIMRRVGVLICVTDCMFRHFCSKYPCISSCRTFLVPILPPQESGKVFPVHESRRDLRTVIYAGGFQAWQNINLMLDSAADQPGFTYIFLTPNKAAMEKMASGRNILAYECDTVPQESVQKRYLQSTFGFVLRSDNLINNVACPTKLVEYMYWGVIPIVIQPSIGDFMDLGYQYLTLSDFLSGALPDQRSLRAMRIRNRQLVDRLYDYAANQLRSLYSELLQSGIAYQ